jgi:RNase P subunit RPR2
MPQKIVCSGCHTTLYEGYEVVEPVEVISQYNSKCPNCGKKLEFDYENIELCVIKPRKIAELA